MQLFQQMQQEEMPPNRFTFCSGDSGLCWFRKT
jgi:hypothetical protein